MTEANEAPPEPVMAPGPSRIDNTHAYSRRLGQAAAWVVIVGGIVFVATVIFFAGMLLGSSPRSHHGWDHDPWTYGVDGRAGICPMMNSGTPGGRP